MGKGFRVHQAASFFFFFLNPTRFNWPKAIIVETYQAASGVLLIKYPVELLSRAPHISAHLVAYKVESGISNTPRKGLATPVCLGCLMSGDMSCFEFFFYNPSLHHTSSTSSSNISLIYPFT
jgi:hypothetical protein